MEQILEYINSNTGIIASVIGGIYTATTYFLSEKTAGKFGIVLVGIRKVFKAIVSVLDVVIDSKAGISPKKEG